MKTKKNNKQFKKNIRTNKNKNKHKQKLSKKYIVFDMDETLGCFQILYTLFYYINSYRNSLNLLNINFYQKSYILDKFPYFFRINIWNILQKIAKLQEKNKNINCVMYTNNNGGLEWPLFIKNYINFKLEKNLFSQVIPIHKIDNRVIEPLRTTNDKTYDDICRCLNIPTTSRICFIDDREHIKMYNTNIYYIKIQEYNYFPRLTNLLCLLENDQNIKHIIPNYIKFLEHIGLNMFKQDKIIDESNINLINEIQNTEKIKNNIFKYLFKKDKL